jgi:Fe-S-cluster containining protein
MTEADESSNLPIIESCDGCGLCCMTMGVPYHYGKSQPGIDPHWENVPEDLKTQLLDFINEGGAELGEPCFWFDRKETVCRHHAYRPGICRDFKLGGQRCVQLRETYGIG